MDNNDDPAFEHPCEKMQMPTASVAIRFRSMAPHTFLLIFSNRTFSILRTFPLTLIGYDKVSTLRRRRLEDRMARVFRYPNVFSNPLANNFSYSGPSQLGGDAGLQLYVGGGIPSDGLVPVAEVNSVREDMLWGSYRAAMKLTLIPGTCGAFFWVCSRENEFSSRKLFDFSPHHPLNQI